MNYHNLLRFGLALTTLALLATGCVVEDDSTRYRDTDYRAEEPFFYSLQVPTQSVLVVEAWNGEVIVEGISATDALEVEGEVVVESWSSDDARRYLRQVEAQLVLQNDRIILNTLQPSDTDGREVTVYYRVWVPRDWVVDIIQDNGVVDVRDTENRVVVEQDNGEVFLTTITGPVEADLGNGNIDLRDIAGSVTATVANGNIFGEVYLPVQGVCDLRAVNGNILLQIPRTTSAEVDLRLTNGTIATRNLRFNPINTTQRTLSGTLGDGEGRIALTTVNGNLTLSGF